MYPDDFVDKMAQVVWQTGTDIGAIRLVANPLAHNGQTCVAKFTFEKRMHNDALGGQVWIEVPLALGDCVFLRDLVQDFVRMRIKEKLEKSDGRLSD